MEYNWRLPSGKTKCVHGTDQSNICEDCEKHFKQKEWEYWEKRMKEGAEYFHDGQMGTH